MSAQKDLLEGTCCSLDTESEGYCERLGREADHSNAEDRKFKNCRLFYRSALVRPVTIETEIPLADKQ